MIPDLTLLTQLDRQVNAALHYQPSNQWMPDARGYADCKGFAMAKYEALKALGVDPARLHLVVVMTGWREEHAVLEVDTAGGRVVLDSLTPWVRPESAVFGPRKYELLYELSPFEISLAENDHE